MSNSAHDQRLIDALQGLAVHDHLCLIYETQAEQFAAIVPFVRLGLERGERCIYIADDNTAQTVLEALQRGGTEADAAIRSGALVIAGKRDAYLKQGYFDPDWMIGFLAESTRAAKAAGFTALRVTGEMTWQLGGDPGVERLIEYEAKLNRFFPEHDALAICQYNRARFSPEIILDVIRTHPLVISGGMVCRNFYYVPPDEFLKPEQTLHEVNRLLTNVREREQAEEALHESEESFRTMFEQSLAGIEIYDESGKLIDVNPACLELFGVESVDAVRGFDLFADPSLPTEARGRLEQGESVKYETTFDFELVRQRALYPTTRSGQCFLNCLITPLRAPDHSITGYLVHVDDITERRRAEEALRRNERSLKDAQRVAHLGSWTLDLAANELRWSDEVYRIFGLEPQEFAASYDAFLETIHPDDRVYVDTAYMNSVQHDVPYDSVHRIVRRSDGTIRYVHEVCENVKDETGRVVRSLGTVHDITELKQAEEELRFRNLLLSTQQEASIDGILVVDENSKIISFNRRFVEMWNIPAEVIESKSDQRALQAVLDMLAEPEQFIQKVSHLYEHRHETSRDEIALRDGRTLDRYSAPMVEPDDRYYGRVWYFRDITERQQRERELTCIATVSAALRAATTRAEMLPIILDQVIALLNAAGAALAMRDPSSGETVIELGRGGLVGYAGLRIPPGQGVNGQVIATGRPYLNNDVRSDPQFYRPDLLDDIRAAACVSLMARGQAIGVVMVGCNVEISEQEVRLLTAVADMAANAIHRATLHEQMERQVQRLMALHTIDTAISASLDLRLTLNVLLDNVIAQLSIDAADVLLFKPDSHMLEHAAARGFRGRGIERTRLWLGEGHAGLAALERRVVAVVDLASSATPFARALLLVEEGFASQHVAPLVVKGQIKGVLEVFHRTRLDPDAEWLEFFETLATQASIAIDNVTLFEGLQRSNIELALAYDSTIEGWSSALDLRDKGTEGHTRRVTELFLQLARALGVTDAELVHFRRGALLHDIGKMGVPDGILLKAGPLTPQEWSVMRTHPQLAYKMLLPIGYLRPALDIPYCHHEKWDGSGYPRGLKGEEIPLAARIFAVVDVWDALRSDRPYRESWPDDKVREHLREQAGKHFDPKVVEAFLEMQTGEQ